MIVKMKKVFVVSRQADGDRLLEELRRIGLMHIIPVDSKRAVAEEKTVSAIDRLGRAMQILSAHTPTENAPEIDPLTAADEALKIQRETMEKTNHLSSLHRQIAQQEIWGEVAAEQLDEIQKAGINVVFASVPAELAGEVEAQCVEAISQMSGKRLLIAIATQEQDTELVLPERTEIIEPPKRSRAAILSEAKETDAFISAGVKRLGVLANLSDAMEKEQEKQSAHGQWTIAATSALTDEKLFAIQGWMPADKASDIADKLQSSNIDAAVELLDPTEDESPPTFIKYPKWTKPIKGLFDILGTFPDYKEHELSSFFMLALPLFAAMLIGDAGYGLLFIVLPLIFYRKLAAGGKDKVNLLITFGVCTLIWGVLTANYFGITPDSLATWGGYVKTNSAGKEVPDVVAMESGTGDYAKVGNLMRDFALLWMAEPAKLTAEQKEAGAPVPWNPRDLIIAVSFLIGCIHLVSAHLLQAIGYLPNKRAISEFGWVVVILGMFGIIMLLFFNNRAGFPGWVGNVALILLIVGIIPAIFYTFPESSSIPKRIGMGLAASLLPLLGTFSDTMSYIRLMAVGLASYYIASAFNGLGATVAAGSPWLWIVGVPVILFGHALNIGLAMIAIFAHGVRLNMLEFSSNAGVQWAGYPYEPFIVQQTKES